MALNPSCEYFSLTSRWLCLIAISPVVPVSFSHTVGYTSGLTSSVHVSPSLFLSSHPRDFDKCEMLVKDLYSKLGLEYRESSSEEEDLAAKPTEVIEIPDDDDDDVMSIDLGWKNSSVSDCALW